MISFLTTVCHRLSLLIVAGSSSPSSSPPQPQSQSQAQHDLCIALSHLHFLTPTILTRPLLSILPSPASSPSWPCNQLLTFATPSRRRTRPTHSTRVTVRRSHPLDPIPPPHSIQTQQTSPSRTLPRLGLSSTTMKVSKSILETNQPTTRSRQPATMAQQQMANSGATMIRVSTLKTMTTMKMRMTSMLVWKMTKRRMWRWRIRSARRHGSSVRRNGTSCVTGR